MIKQYPKIKFKIEQEKEIEIYFNFLRDAKYHNLDREMRWAFYGPYPELKVLKKNLTKRQKEIILQNYIKKYYKEYIPLIKKGAFIAKKQWKKYERAFFILTDNIFSNYPWPKGKYIAYPTIWGMYPRNIKNKVFWFPIKHKKKNYISVVIAHEMLHFVFYDYLYKHYPKYKNHKYDFKIWNISEAFNIVIQNSPEWVKIFKEKCKFYPGHKRLIKKMQKIWQEKQNIDYLLKRVLP